MKNTLFSIFSILILLLSGEVLSQTKDLAKAGMIGGRYSDLSMDSLIYCKNASFNGFEELRTIFKTVPRNQGITNDSKYFYISPDHHTIEKRLLSNYELVNSATYPDKIGGLFYDSESDEILTCSGQYETGGDAFISRINKNTLALIETIDISKYTGHGVNAIVRLDTKIYVGETAVNDDAEPKSWYSFDSNFKFIDTVFSHSSSSGSYDWQDATVYRDRIIATDHNGVVYSFCVLPDGQLSPIGKHDSSGLYFEGITLINNLFYIWKNGDGIVAAKMK